MNSSLNKVLVVSHDAGGANVLAAWLEKEQLKDQSQRWYFRVEGPAEVIFRARFPQGYYLDEQDSQNVRGYQCVITGTSGQSDLERVYIAKAKSVGVKVASALDHWSNYLKRFTFEKRGVIYPDEIWVFDDYAMEKASRLPDAPSVLQKYNYYLDDQKEKISQLTSAQNRLESEGNATCIRTLYICEPSTQYRYDEFDVMKAFLQFAKKQQSAQNHGKYEILIRTHPSEPDQKYQSVLEQYTDTLVIKESCGNALEEDIAWSQWVVGCQSMAMVVALMANKRVSTVIPRSMSIMQLPHKGIEYLF